MRVKLLVILFLWCIPARAYYYKQYTTSDGLISDLAYHSLRDSKGYLWFFTDKGVSKFDGETFKNFTQDQGLADHEMFSGYEDKEGRLWLFTYNGNFCYIKDDKIYNVYNDPFLKTLPVTSFIEYMYETEDSSIYLAYKNGKIIKIKKNTFLWIISAPSQFYDFDFLYQINDTLKALRHDCEISILNDKIVRTDTTERLENFAEGQFRITIGVNEIQLKSRDRIIWKKKDKYLHYGNVLHAYYDQKDHIFCGTTNGLYIINKRTGKTDILFKNYKVSSINIDLYGNYWITTLDNGIFYLNKHLKKISYLEKVSNFRTVVTNNQQTFFLNDSKIYYYHNDALIDIGAPIKNNIDPLYVDDNTLIYTIGLNLFRFDRAEKKTEKIETPNSRIGLKCLYPLGNDHYIFVWEWSVSRGVLGHHNISEISDTLGIFRIGKNCFNHKNTVYVASNNHICSYTVLVHKFSLIDSFNEYNSSISNMYLVNGRLLVTSNTDRVISYNMQNSPITKQAIRYPVACYDIMQTSFPNEFILNTSKGYYLSKDLYDFSSGASFIESPIAGDNVLSITTGEGKILCNVGGSFYSFSDSLLNNDKKTPVFFIDKISVNEKNVRATAIQVNNSIRTHVSLALSYLKFDLAAPYTYQYRIIHSDTSKWIRTQSDNPDIYLEKSGNYVIEIRAVSENNLPSASQYIMLSITPPFYYSYPFYTMLFIILCLIIVYGVRRYNIRRTISFNNELNYLQLEQKALNSLLSPDFIFNSISNIQTLVNSNAKDAANNYLAVLSKLIRQNIENLQFSFISITRELNLVRNYVTLQNLHFDYNIDLNIQDNTDKAEEIVIPPLLIHMFVENSVMIAQSNRKALSLNISLDITIDDYLIIKITDNNSYINEYHGPVFSPVIDAMRKRLTRLSAFYKVAFSLDIKDSSELQESGSEVIIMVYAKFKSEVKNDQ